MHEENTAEEIELELEVPEEEVDTHVADVDANAADQLSLVPDVEEIEAVSEDRSPEDRVKEYLDSDPQLQEYGDGVQKRINKLTYQREEAKRREEAAVQYAQQVQMQLQQFQTQAQQVTSQRDEQLMDEYGNRINAELETAKQRYKEAYESGDADLIVEANKELSALSVEQERVKRRPKRTAEVTPMVAPQEVQQYYNQPAPIPAAPPQPDPQASAWATENTWFGEDEAMTHTALGYHRKLVEEEHVDPHSAEYYEKINGYMRTNFPHRFDNTANGGTVNNNSPVQTVAPAGRTVGGKTGRKVKLTQSQVAIAKRLGVPLKEYAKYV